MVDKFFRISAWTISVLIGSVFVAALWTSEEQESIAVWRQPAHIDYRSFGPYVLALEASTARFHVLESSPMFILRIFRAADHDENSFIHVEHYFKIGTLSRHDPVEFARNAKVNWTQEGLEFVSASGHRVFFPKSTFAGGR